MAKNQCASNGASHASRMEAVLTWLEEDAALAETYNMPAMASSRRADADFLRKNVPAETVTPPPPGVLPPIPHVEGNPMITQFFKDLEQRIVKPNKRFPKGPDGGKARTGEGWQFMQTADQLLSLSFAFCHPQSTRAGDAALVGPILRRLAFFAEYMAEKGPLLGDFGPCSNIADCWLIVYSARPEIVPPSVKEGMEVGVKNNAHAIIAKCPYWATTPSKESYCLFNCDIRFVLAVAITDRLYPTPEYAKAWRNGLAYLEPHIMEDGAQNYWGQQNECPTYHEIGVYALTRMHQVMGEPKALEMVKQMRWYYPIVVSPTGVIEWATATSWHHYWNTSNCSAAALVKASICNCPHNQRVAKGASGNLWLAAYYDPSRPVAPWPDNYLMYDRNVEGPRGRFGTWSPVGTTRKSKDDRGKSSYVGCVVETGNPGAWQLDAALQDACMEVRLNPAKDRGNEHWGRVVLAQVEPITTCAVGESAAALGAVARLAEYLRPATEWLTRQLWLITSQRLVGLVALEAGADCSAAGIFGCLFLVSGREKWGVRKELESLSDGEFKYGALRIKFHSHDFASTDHEYTDVMAGALNASGAKKSCRLLLLDEAAKDKTCRKYPKGSSHYYLVEVRPEHSPPASVSEYKHSPELLTFTVEEGSVTHKVAFNPGEKPIDVAIKQPGTLHVSGEKYRPEWIQEAGPVGSRAPQPAPPSWTLPSGELMFVSSSVSSA